MGTMKRPLRTMTRAACAAMLLLSVAATVRPTVFMQTGGGLWEVSRNNGGRRTVCLPDPVALAQYEHLRSNCSRDLVRNLQSRAEIHYTCGGGAFGQSTV